MRLLTQLSFQGVTSAVLLAGCLFGMGATGCARSEEGNQGASAVVPTAAPELTGPDLNTPVQGAPSGSVVVAGVVAITRNRAVNGYVHSNAVAFNKIQSHITAQSLTLCITKLMG